MQKVQLGNQRSLRLGKEDKKKFQRLMKMAETKVAAAGLLGVKRDTIARMSETGRCAPQTLDKLRAIDLDNISAA